MTSARAVNHNSQPDTLPYPPSGGGSALDSLLKLTYSREAAERFPGAVREYNKKLVYIILQIVEANTSITSNQVCGLLRNTLQVPEAMTKEVIKLMIAGSSSVANMHKLLKAFPTSRGAVHLNVFASGQELKSILDAIAQEYPELLHYTAPEYKRGPIFKKGQ
jgi:hypothetical protein